MIQKEKNNMIYYTFPEIEGLDFIDYAVSTRFGGVSEGAHLKWLNLGSKTKDTKENVQKNYTLFCEALGMNPKRVVLGNQTHSVNVRKTGSFDAGKGVFKERDYTDVDALITNEKLLPLAIHTADCVPVTLIDTKNKAIGNAHCGWRGTLGRLGAKTLSAMQATYGTSSKDVIALIGPCIHKCCYEVSKDLYEQFLAKFSDNDLIFEQNHKFYLDLPGLNKKTLSDLGVTVYESGICTCCNCDTFYSHRGLGPDRGIFATFIQLK
ncbi:MAG: peptidoglycan editing factor PgeF [Clostridia bacterium]|nr:peptidoglycan editing factor PgeF [Clostridia bacterium]